jgi:hypothetical protein
VQSPGEGKGGRPVPRGLVGVDDVGVDRERPSQVLAGRAGPAEVGLDGGKVVPEDGVTGAQADGGAGVGEGGAGPPGLAERPGEGVLAVDRGPRPGGLAGQRDRRGRVAAGVAGPVGLSAGQLEVDRHPVGPVQDLDRADQAVLAGGQRAPPEGGLDLAQERDRGWQG